MCGVVATKNTEKCLRCGRWRPRGEECQPCAAQPADRWTMEQYELLITAVEKIGKTWTDGDLAGSVRYALAVAAVARKHLPPKE